jgi:DNA-binding transcriptional ArsR family regulator
VSAHRDAFSALADPTRRAVLDLLRRTSSLTAGEIAAEFPNISRPAVSKHLGVLRDAGLVHVREQGREWHYQLDARPLAEIYENWLRLFAPLWDASLEQLKNQVERSTRPIPGKRAPLS